MLANADISLLRRGRPPPHSYGSLQQNYCTNELDDDAVSVALKKFMRRISWMISLWLMSYVIVMLQVIDKGHFIRWTVVLFIPMWSGSFVGFLAVLSVFMLFCFGDMKLITKDEFHALKSSSVKPVPDSYLHYDSIPLLRRLLFWSCTAVVFVTMITLSQVIHKIHRIIHCSE